jgi:YgiT-type zinc finger domain-containing protein
MVTANDKKCPLCGGQMISAIADKMELIIVGKKSIILNDVPVHTCKSCSFMRTIVSFSGNADKLQLTFIK